MLYLALRKGNGMGGFRVEKIGTRLWGINYVVEVRNVRVKKKSNVFKVL